ncbi:DUF4442 domain-containing protein [Catenovulum sp. SM1970]|uniref:DUF4442 domain-containing protein n=1 Tax=Marinifaba aquimaris TaxID=2741323 RepID=UPI001572E8F9|nr:DUF4442 domain-containing protein [Marinifaba aquimaris]NTS76042.1 DUF4442 domain-containing protein [Marinifaba aquimaris]
MKLLFKYPWLLRWGMNIWPPFFFSGIKISRLKTDFSYAQTMLKWRSWNLNANRSQYGGSMASMTDPMYSILLIGTLGHDYFVWDKSFEIDFIKPGVGKLTAEFEVTEQHIAEIKKQTADGEKYCPTFDVYIKNASDEVICHVKKTLYIRLKPHARPKI